MEINGKAIDEGTLCVEGADSSDYPDFVDAFFSEACYLDGTQLKDDELGQLTEDYPETVNEMAFESFL